MMNISVIGLGKLGSPLAATIASKGFNVIGVDINKEVIANLNKGKTILKEPQLAELISQNRQRLEATPDIKKAVLDTEITFIITPTPSKADGSFSLDYVIPVIREIGEALKNKKRYHSVVLVSTVMPGSSGKMFDLLMKTSQKSAGDFGFCYNPEFIALGSVVRNLLNPDFILIGQSSKKVGDILQDFYKKYLDKSCPISRMNFVNAELAKISVNTFITTKISYANMLGEICEALEGGDVDTVTKAIGLDTRIGTKYLTGGPSFGGPCFPRDNLAFISLAKKLKADFEIPLATHTTNQNQIKNLVKRILSINKNKTVGILGMSYKIDTDVVEESTGINLAKALIEKKFKVNVHDPLGIENSKKMLGDSAKYFESAKDLVQSSETVVITTNWPEYMKINSEYLKNVGVLIDLWRIIDTSKLPKTLTYIPFGINKS